MSVSKIKSTAVLIGYRADGECVYSEICELSEYYDGDHVWDSGKKVQRLKLQRVKGYLFDANGNLSQEFESEFDPSSGTNKSGRARYADGTVIVNPPKP